MSDELIIRKMVGWLHVTDEQLIDAGLLEAPPLSPEEERWHASQRRRWALAYAVASPIDWLGRGASWLHVEALNALLWLVRAHGRVEHDRPRDDDEW